MNLSNKKMEVITIPYKKHLSDIANKKAIKPSSKEAREWGELQFSKGYVQAMRYVLDNIGGGWKFEEKKNKNGSYRIRSINIKDFGVENDK